MPVSHRSLVASLRPLHYRILRILMPEEDAPFIDWPLLVRAQIVKRLGYSPTNNLNRALNGTSSHPGLVRLGLLEAVIFDIDGVDETSYRITEAGIKYARVEENSHTSGSSTVDSTSGSSTVDSDGVQER